LKQGETGIPIAEILRQHDISEGQPTHLRLGLFQQEPHVHLAVHRRRGGEVVAGLLPLARLL
jgi:hypothetical protein